MQIVTLPARPPVRAFAISAGLALAGGLCLLVGDQLRWPIVGQVIGWLLLASAVVLAGLGLYAMRAMRVQVELSAAGYAFRRGSQLTAGRWADVERATRSVRGDRITLHLADDNRTVLTAPGGPGPVMDELANAISRHLDADRGYGTSQGAVPPGETG